MKHVLYLSWIALFFSACGHTPKEQAREQICEQTCEQICEAKPYDGVSEATIITTDTTTTKKTVRKDTINPKRKSKR